MKLKTIRYSPKQFEDKKLATGFEKTKTHLRNPACIMILLLIIPMMATFTGYAQKKSLNFHILRNGSKVGTLRFSETIYGEKDSLKMESDVKTKFIFTFIAHAREDAIFSNGILSQSSIYRQINGNEKVNKRHRADNSRYIIFKGNDSNILKNYPISYNMLSFYSKEPENIAAVYSDNFETFVVIQKLDVHKYKIVLPDGNYTLYHYKNGTLNMIEVHHTLYSANIVLENN